MSAACRSRTRTGQPWISERQRRERGLDGAARSLVDGEWDAGCADLDRALCDYPRDAFAMSREADCVPDNAFAFHDYWHLVGGRRVGMAAQAPWICSYRGIARGINPRGLREKKDRH